MSSNEAHNVKSLSLCEVVFIAKIKQQSFIASLSAPNRSAKFANFFDEWIQ
jgi:hypothetical protein